MFFLLLLHENIYQLREREREEISVREREIDEREEEGLGIIYGD